MKNSNSLSFSIIINTYNRIGTLPKTLESLQFLRYDGDFEVIVVNGPSTDGTTEYLKKWESFIKIGNCDETNLSKSRNIGIALAQGDIVAFIDDDAIPDADWLTDLAKAYESPDVGGAGGRVFDRSGYKFQAEYITVDRLGKAEFSTTHSEDLSYPYAWKFPHSIGTNASFRRSVLLEIGGFDEEYDYYLDETDVCVRVIDAGYKIAQLKGAYIFHKYAESHIRDKKNICRNYIPIVKNKIYYSLKYASDFMSYDDIMKDNNAYIEMHRSSIKWGLNEGILTQDDVNIFENQISIALRLGTQRGLSRDYKMLSLETLELNKSSFKVFTPKANIDSKKIVLIDRWFDSEGGISTLYRTLAKELSDKGHIVHVFCHSSASSTVDMEDGIWVHRIEVKHHPRSEEAIAHEVPQPVWDWSMTALAECHRISQDHPVDIVESTIWDCEGCAFLFDKTYPLVTCLVTPLRAWLHAHPNKMHDTDWMNNFFAPMTSLEKYIMENSTFIRADSKSIITEIEKDYQMEFAPEYTAVTLLGISDIEYTPVPREDFVNILYVGRFESRKGIDVLLNIIPSLMEKYMNIKFTLIGNDTIIEKNISYKDDFINNNQTKEWFSRIHFLGRVSEDDLKKAYHKCDIFVAPSRFESFGLIFLEAMREGKPVIGCNAGGMPEIIIDGVTGILASPGDTQSLSDAIIHLIEDEHLRKNMGKEGRKRFIEHFTSKKMADASIEVYNKAINIYNKNNKENNTIK